MSQIWYPILNRFGNIIDINEKLGFVYSALQNHEDKLDGIGLNGQTHYSRYGTWESDTAEPILVPDGVEIPLDWQTDTTPPTPKKFYAGDFTKDAMKSVDVIKLWDELETAYKKMSSDLHDLKKFLATTVAHVRVDGKPLERHQQALPCRIGLLQQLVTSVISKSRDLHFMRDLWEWQETDGTLQLRDPLEPEVMVQQEATMSMADRVKYLLKTEWPLQTPDWRVYVVQMDAYVKMLSDVMDEVSFDRKMTEKCNRAHEQHGLRTVSKVKWVDVPGARIRQQEVFYLVNQAGHNDLQNQRVPCPAPRITFKPTFATWVNETGEQYVPYYEKLTNDLPLHDIRALTKTKPMQVQKPRWFKSMRDDKFYDEYECLIDVQGVDPEE